MSDQNKIDSGVMEDLLFLLTHFPEENINLSEETQTAKADAAQGEYPLSAVNHLKSFMDKMPGGFFIYRADGNEEIIYANDAMLRLFNCTTMEEFCVLTGNSFRGLVHPDDLEEVERSIWEQIVNSQYDLDYVEYRIIQKGGGIRWIDDYGHFIHTEAAGDVFYVFVGDATDKRRRLEEEREAFISEKRQKERQLQSRIEEYDQELEVIHQEHFRRLEMIEGLSIDYESIFFVDLDLDRLRTYRVSRRYAEKFAIGQSVEFTGFDEDYIRDWVHPEDRELLAGISCPDYIRQKLYGEKTFHINYRIIQDGQVTYMQLRIVNVSGDQNVSQVIMGYRNVDDEIIQEMKQKQMLAKALKEANQANRAKNAFLANMSHDIRTPMNGIVGFTALAQKYLDDREKVSEYLDMISKSGDQLLQLLNDVLEISRIESGSFQTEEDECSLVGVAEQIQAAVAPRAKAKNISFSADISGLRHRKVRTDRQKLVRILSCLVDNAVKYTKEGGRITVSVTEQENVLSDYAAFQFVVEDNGIGISQEFAEHIFSPFEREKNTTMSGIYGTGLGLTIAKNLVEMLGGTIEVASVPGEGSRFTVSLSLRVRDEQEIVCGEDRNSLMKFSSPKRILVVDDNEINLEIEKVVLREAGFLVETAENGKIALEKIRKGGPGYYDLVLMDIQMPVMDGLQAAKAIRALKDPALSGLPILAVSANAFEEDKKKSLESGMNAHLAKPLDVDLLFRVMRKFL